jgi:DNA (cytosine-5)-methyltransferase 1
MNVAVRPEHAGRGVNILSICTGGYGLDFGVELAMPDARTVCMVEGEAFAAARLVTAMQQGLLAPAPVWSDARTFDGRAWRGVVDGLIGGIPCQPHSLAGKRLGASDERDLWSPARRIIVQSGVWFVFIENVPGMLNAKAGQFPGALRVRRDLRRLGFEVEGGLFTAAEVGDSQVRERVFILAVADALGGFPVCGRSRSIHGAREEAEGQTQGEDGERRRTNVGDRCERMACPVGARSSVDICERHDALGEFPSSSGVCRSVVDAAILGCGEGRAEPKLRRRRGNTSPRAGDELARSRRAGCTSRDQRGLATASEGGAALASSSSRPVEDAAHGLRQLHARQRRRGSGAPDDRGAGEGLALFPPGPADLDGWAAVLARAPQLEPAIRRMADGVASRVDELRLLGNGVVSLEGAYAFRTLATRLADRGSAGAARLVRLMGFDQ